MSCSTPPNFFGTPDFNKIFLHCMIFLELPIHFFGAYCILFKTPKRMQHVKWTMFNVHFWTALLDISISGLMVPVMLLPAVAGYNTGLMTWIGIDMVYQVYFNFSVSFTVGSSIVSLLECRYNLFMGGPRWQRWRIPFYIFNYTFSWTFLLPQVTILLPDQEEALTTYKQFIPCSEKGIPKAIIGLKLSSEFSYMMLVLGYYSVHTVFSGVYFGFAVQLHLRKIKNTSKITASLQSKLQFAVITQIMIPITVMVAPVFLAIWSVLTGYHNMVFNNFTVIAMCFHGMVSTSAMILLHQPYRDTLTGMIPNKSRVESSSFVSNQIRSVVL